MGAENRNHPPRLCPREMLLPCRHAASPCPTMGHRLLLAGHAARLAQGQGGQGHGGDPLLWPWPLRSRATLAGRAGLGWGEKIPEPGKADALLEGRGTPSQTGDGVSVQLQGEDHLYMGAKGSPWLSQATLRGLCQPALPQGSCSSWGQA